MLIEGEGGGYACEKRKFPLKNILKHEKTEKMTLSWGVVSQLGASIHPPPWGCKKITNTVLP